MKPSDIVAHLRSYCPLFERRIAGGINWEAVRDDTQMKALAAYVVPTDEKASDPLYDNVLVQELTEGVDVVVVFPQQQESGYGVADQVSAVRRELCRALVGWTPPGASASLIYEGRSFLHTDRTKAAYAFSFSAQEVLGNVVLPSDPDAAETWTERELLGLPPLEGVDINVDLIDPAVDKNIKPDGVGPDGRIEHQLKKDFPHD
jgi:hypothetical protein